VADLGHDESEDHRFRRGNASSIPHNGTLPVYPSTRRTDARTITRSNRTLYWFPLFVAFATGLRISRETIGVPSQGMLVTKRSVPLLSSNASPDCAEAPRKVPQDLGNVATQPGVQICDLGGFGAAA
jgi:hypothetical protein